MPPSPPPPHTHQPFRRPLSAASAVVPRTLLGGRTAAAARRAYAPHRPAAGRAHARRRASPMRQDRRPALWMGVGYCLLRRGGAARYR
eukprot:3168778-Pleurochrysis_carterae.AAC.1